MEKLNTELFFYNETDRHLRYHIPRPSLKFRIGIGNQILHTIIVKCMNIHYRDLYFQQ